MLSITHSFFLSPSNERFELIDGYIDMTSNLDSYMKSDYANLSSSSLRQNLERKESIYASLHSNYKSAVISTEVNETLRNQYFNFLELKASYPSFDYKELEYASDFTDNFSLLMVSYLNSPRTSRINAINEYLYFVTVTSKNQNSEQNKRSLRSLKNTSQPLIDMCCSQLPYSYAKNIKKHILPHTGTNNGNHSTIAQQGIWEQSTYFLAHGLSRFFLGDAEYYKKKDGDKKRDAFREINTNFQFVESKVPFYFQLQNQRYNSDAIENTHSWLKKKYKMYEDKGSSKRSNGLQNLYGAVVQMADSELKGVRYEEDYYKTWFDTSTYNSNDYALKRLNQLQDIYKYFLNK